MLLIQHLLLMQLQAEQGARKQNKAKDATFLWYYNYERPQRPEDESISWFVGVKLLREFLRVSRRSCRQLYKHSLVQGIHPFLRNSQYLAALVSGSRVTS